MPNPPMTPTGRVALSGRTGTAAICGLLLAACQGDDKVADSLVNTYTVTREDLPITVKESGELLALRETVVRSDVEGQATIISLIPEGTRVQTGEKLVELNVAELVEKRANQEISVEKARNSLEQARAQQDILEKELRTKENSAASQLRIAQMELEKLLGSGGGKGSEGRNADMVKRLEDLVDPPETAAELPPTEGEANDADIEPDASFISHVKPQNYRGLVGKAVQLLRVEGEGDPLQRAMGEIANKILQQADQIRLAMADLKVKEDTYSHSRRLASKQFITRNELERDKLAYQSQASQVTIAWNNLELLINYTLERDRLELTQNLANAELEVERVRASNDAERTKSQFDVASKQKEFEVATERLANLERQIKNAIIYSPASGLVVYARVEGRRGSEAVQEGTSVRERQAILVLPDNSRLLCEIKVQEAQIDKVMVGQPAHVSVEAFPTEVLTGRVVRVAPVADSSNSWMGNDKKVYTTVVEIDGTNADERLKARMAAAATITVDMLKDVLAVPIQAVRRDRSVNYVWQATPNGPLAVKVLVGAHNQEKVVILEGLAEGDRVYRTPPGGVVDPKFDQPVLPDHVPVEAPPPSAQPRGPIVSGDSISPPTGSGGSGAPGSSGPGSSGPGSSGPGSGGPGGNGGGGRSRGMLAAFDKPIAEMNAEELSAAKAALDQSETMVDRLRERSPEMADAMAARIQTIRTALAANDLAKAQAEVDAWKASMRRPGGRSPGGNPGGGPGGGGQGGRDRDGE